MNGPKTIDAKLIEPGSPWQRITIAPEDAAFLEMRAKLVESVTSWYGAAREELDWDHLNDWTRYLTEKIEEPPIVAIALKYEPS